MPFINHVPNIDFLGQRKIAAVVSTILCLASLALMIFRGPSWGIDFTGGSEIHLKFASAVAIEDVRAAMSTLELGADSVQQVGPAEDGEYIIRIQDPTFGTAELRKNIEGALVAKYGASWLSESTFDAEVGSRMTVRYSGPEVGIAEIQSALAGVSGAEVAPSLDDNTFYVKLPGITSAVQKSLSSALEGHPFQVLQVDSVGPSVGADLRSGAFLSLGITMVLIMVYVGFRFDMTFAPGAVIAVFHDVTNVVGVFIALEMLGVFDREFNLPIIGALLTILGSSMNDTVVIYDRIRENQRKYRRKDLAQLMNLSVNETLGRTLGTFSVTFLSMLPFLFLGDQTVRTFALAMLLGIVFGTYSTVYVASPLTLVFEDLRPVFARFIAGGGGAEAKETEPKTESERRRKEREANLAGRRE